jgi:hypothetical protein
LNVGEVVEQVIGLVRGEVSDRELSGGYGDGLCADGPGARDVVSGVANYENAIWGEGDAGVLFGAF